MPLSHSLSLREKLALFWPRLHRTWKVLAMLPIVVVAGIFSAFVAVFLDFFDFLIDSEIRAGISGFLMTYILIKYMDGLDFKKPTEPFKLRPFALPKKIYSLEMWIDEAPYTGVFILIVVLCLAKYGQDFQQSGLPSGIEIFIVLFLLGMVYVVCVLAQGYSDFAKQEWGSRRNGRHIHHRTKHHRTRPPRRYQS